MYKDVFSGIYDNFGFGSTESRSGPGSTLEETRLLRDRIKDLIKVYDIKSVVDAPCGDFNWMKEIVFSFERYMGGDIVEACIKENNERYSNSRIKFITLDLLKDEIPEGDLLIVRDIIGHFPIEDGKKIVDNILKSNCKYLLSTTWAKKIENNWSKCNPNDVHRENEGAEYGRFYPVNLMAEPFNFPEAEVFLEEDVAVDNFENGNRKALAFWDIQKIKTHLASFKSAYEEPKQQSNSLTIVSGLWNINKPGRSFDHYLECFDKFLKIPQNMFLFVPKELESFVWERRSPKNTRVKIFELEDIKTMYGSFWDKTQKIRTSDSWLNLAGWLKNSPQASLEWYNPIVMSKMSLLHDASIFDSFATENFIWLDAGITNTINYNLLISNNFFEKLENYLSPLLFIQYHYPYYDKGIKEVHGFEWEALNQYGGGVIEWICRGGLFGGKKEAIREANSHYWHMLNESLSNGYMGTEESIFSILAHKHPELFRTAKININGHIQEFVSKVLDDTAVLEDIPIRVLPRLNNYVDISKLKMSVYMLTFNFPHQVEHTIQTWLKHDNFLIKTRNILIDNSTNEEARIANKAVCDKYNFEHIITNENTGINGGRFRAAQHFQESDSDYYLFLEDDMGIHEASEGFCRNGFRTYVPNLYDKVLKIMRGSDLDFLKLSYTEVYMDNHIQVSWYNVPQSVRTEFWPDYDKLPINGLDLNCPRTKFNNIENIEGLSYITGDIYYCNWPTIAGKKGNQKMFLDTTWARPYEQTWMSYMFQETKKGNLKPAVLLASPINHNRIAHYTPEERREN
jgi:hypothetical protein